MSQLQKTDPSINPPFKTAAVIGGNVLMSSDKTLTPNNARELAESLTQSADMAESSQPLQDELKLISVCQEIGGIAGSNNQYTLSLTLHINKPTESLTVAQLLAFHRECNERFNQGVSHA
ncbi:MAG: hypothetical protein KZQ83_17785 [gamma proteobacterium symbiont of Taylorina sp.]|nr:hypothetical protein [gamma proteobacterium symbiont of Taylorina sp.]